MRKNCLAAPSLYAYPLNLVDSDFIENTVWERKMGIQFAPRTYEILAVDDKPENLFTLQELLKKVPNIY